MRAILSSLIILILCCSSPTFGEDDNKKQEIYKNLEAFSNVLSLMEQYYVDEIDTTEVINGAINGMLTSLDPHSTYMQPDDYKELQNETKGTFTGIGIEIAVRNDILTVVAPIEGTPAHTAGIMAGDQIIRIEGEPTKNMTMIDAVKKIRGRKGSSITITIHRPGVQELKDVTLERDVIPLHSVKSYELGPGIFTVRITNFQANTSNDLQKILDDIEGKKEIAGLVLDLRDNPGGLLDQAVRVSDIFLDGGVIVSTKGRDPQQDVIYTAHKNKRNYSFPIIALVNGGSASASEIVAGALQDHRRAIIMGTVTFGKGSVQTIIPMPDGAGLRLTTARYYTPSGDSIQATGIKPDVVVDFEPYIEKEQKNGELSLREKDLPNHFTNHDESEDKKKDDAKPGPENTETSEEDVAKKLQRDNQMRTALIILKSLRIAAMAKETQLPKTP
ncbi:MAG: S41 family peptidase [Desulfobulbaceae bacterium]|nr:S41 family peptidase [Desulfobulbaceae bacterium]